ncbi:MAG: murein biosynthesis integral membrane protein MurJ [Verrucomicrobiota bacterium]
MSKNLHNIAVVSLSTVGSRVLGLVRDIMIFAALGASVWSSAFFVAFTLPNLFRRLLGEGALSSAFVPVFSDVLKHGGRLRAFWFFNSVLLRLVVVLVALTCLLGLNLKLADSMDMLPHRWSLASGFTITLLPYMIFICTAAIFAAALNTMGRFLASACTPILLNLSMIGSLALGMSLGLSVDHLIWYLCGGVLFGGFLQLAVPALDFWSKGWRPTETGETDRALIRDLWRLLLPGLIGGAILQVNILVSRLLAYSLDASATSILYLASRLMELPLGVFTISVVTVFFPVMAKAYAARDEKAFSEALLSGMRLILAIAVPAGVGLILLAEPILETLFQWGAFDRADVLATVPLIAIYGFGLPFYSVATLATRGLHASKEMKVPVRIAGISLMINTICSLILMQFLEVSGLALANVIAAVVQSVLIWRSVAKTHPSIQWTHLKKALLQILVASAVLALVCLLVPAGLGLLGLGEKSDAFAVVLICIPLAVGVYLGLLYRFKFEEMDVIKDFGKRLR